VEAAGLQRLLHEVKKHPEGLLLSLPRVGQRIHFKKIVVGYLVVTTKSYAELA